MSDNKRKMNMIEMINLRAQNSALIIKSMAATNKEEATAMMKQIKTNAARIAELENEQYTFAHKQLINLFKGR